MRADISGTASDQNCHFSTPLFCIMNKFLQLKV